MSIQDSLVMRTMYKSLLMVEFEKSINIARAQRISIALCTMIVGHYVLCIDKLV